MKTVLVTGCLSLARYFLYHCDHCVTIKFRGFCKVEKRDVLLSMVTEFGTAVYRFANTSSLYIAKQSLHICAQLFKSHRSKQECY